MLNGPDDVHVGDEQHGDEPDEQGEDTGDAVGLLPAGNDADDSPSSICAVAFAFPARARAAASTPARFRFFPPKGTPLAFAASGAAGIGRASPSLRLLVWRSRCFAVGACSAARFLRREAGPGERALMWSPSNVERTRVSAVYRLVPSVLVRWLAPVRH